MVGWHNATSSVTTVSDFTATASNIIGFHRGSLGWIGINGSGSVPTAGYSTGLPDGVYCDVITGGATNSAGNVTWESRSNRTYSTGTASTYTVSDTWK